MSEIKPTEEEWKAFFWHNQPSYLLAKAEEKGYIEHRLVNDRQAFRLTEAGKEKLNEIKEFRQKLEGFRSFLKGVKQVIWSDDDRDETSV